MYDQSSRSGRFPRSFADECIVLKRSNYAEADRVIVLLSRRWGKFAAVAKGVRKLTSRKAPHIEPYSRSRLFFVAGHGMPIITQAETQRLFGDSKLDLDLARFAFQLGELTAEMLNEGEAHAQVFDRLDLELSSLPSLTLSEAKDAVTTFQLFLLDVLGFGQPQNEAPTEYIERLLDRRLRSFKLGQL